MTANPEISWQASLALSAAILFSLDPHWRPEPTADGRYSRGAAWVCMAVVCALSALSGFAAVEYPLTFAEVFNQL